MVSDHLSVHLLSNLGVALPFNVYHGDPRFWWVRQTQCFNAGQPKHIHCFVWQEKHDL